jgi:hypothetical protein
METKDQQIKHVVEGMALGVLAQNVEAVTSNKMAFEFAFDRAWSNWSRAGEFPGITGHDPGNVFWIGVQKSERRQGVSAAWARGRWSEPYLLGDYATVEACLDSHADQRASAAEWVELGRLYVDYFKPEELRLS